MKTEAAEAVGKGQKAIMEYLNSRRDDNGQGPSNAEVDLPDMVRNRMFKGIHFADIMSAAEALKKKGLINYNGKTLSRKASVVQAFEEALLVERVVLRSAMEHPSEHARKKYLRDHPGAEPSRHTVNKDLPKAKKTKPEVDMSDVHPTNSNYDAIKKLREEKERAALRSAMEHPSEKAKAQYLKDHPGADKSNHHVQTDDGGAAPKGPDANEVSPREVSSQIEFGSKGLSLGVPTFNGLRSLNKDINSGKATKKDRDDVLEDLDFEYKRVSGKKDTASKGAANKIKTLMTLLKGEGVSKILK